MHPGKFWEFVRENLWFATTYLAEEWVLVEIKERLESPPLLFVYLAQTLPAEIEWIAFRPFKREILNAEYAESKEPRMNGRWVHYCEYSAWSIVWHRKDETPHSRFDDLGEGTVGDRIARIAAQGGMIDAIVHWHEIGRMKREDWKRPATRTRLLQAGHANISNYHTFDIYAPPKSKT